MSVEALLIATRNHLRTQLVSLIPASASANAKHYIGIQPDGHPPAKMGEWYVSMDEASVQSLEKDFVSEICAINIFITIKVGQYPPDAYDSVYESNAKSLWRLERPILEHVHNNHTLRAAANTWLGVPNAAVGDSIINPLWYTGRSRTRPEGGDWAGCEPDRFSFLVRTLSFAGGRRNQAMDVIG